MTVSGTRNKGSAWRDHAPTQQPAGAQGQGLGAGLLLDALGRTLHVAGVRALAVHAKHDKAAAFYKHFGFVASLTDVRHLYRIIKAIRNAAERS